MRAFVSFPIFDLPAFKKKLMCWANQFSTCCVLDSNRWQGSKYELIAGIGKMDELLPAKNSFEALKKFQAEKNDWLFGHLSYDLKNEIENLYSRHPDGVCFSEMHFFQPKYVFFVSGHTLEIGFLSEHSSEKEIAELFAGIQDAECRMQNAEFSIEVAARVKEDEYIRTVNKIKQHIHRGDIYELNYCVEFFCEQAEINPAETFLRLNESAQSPFSAFYRIQDKYLLCASPERFLKKSGVKIISQPIKGTARRGNNKQEDSEIKKLLLQNEKEKSENVMIVDLVRNDLSRTCHTVRADELFGIYTFERWHQMMSTVSGEMRNGVHFTDVIKHCFPMGSMTGAPKIRAMALIEQYEKTKRGLYSGAIGYITPEGDFDFNVVIRSILYNQSSKYLSFQSGSAITFNSVPENEYAECMLKAKGMLDALAPSKEGKKNMKYQNMNAEFD